MNGPSGVPGVEPIGVSYEFDLADVLASRRMFWPNTYWFDRAAIVVFVSIGITFEIGSDAMLIGLGSFVLAAILALRLYVLVPHAIARNQRSLLGKVNVVRLDEDGLHDDLGGVHNFVEWTMLTEVIEDDETIGIRLDLRGGYAIPKRAFATPAELEAFVGYARARITPARHATRVSQPSTPPRAR